MRPDRRLTVHQFVSWNGGWAVGTHETPLPSPVVTADPRRFRSYCRLCSLYRVYETSLIEELGLLVVNSTCEIKSSEVYCLLLRVPRPHRSDSGVLILPTLGPVNPTPREIRLGDSKSWGSFPSPNLFLRRKNDRPHVKSRRGGGLREPRLAKKEGSRTRTEFR